MTALIFHAIMDAHTGARAMAEPWAQRFNLTHHTVGDITAIVSPAPKKRLLDGLLKSTAGRELLVGQQVLEGLLGFGDVLPAAGGAVLADARAVRRFVAGNAAALTARLARHRGQMQYQIVVRWDPANALARFRDDPVMAPVRAAAGDRAKLGPALQTAGEALRTREGAVMAEALVQVSQDIVRLPLADPNMVLNACVLVARDGDAAVEAALEALDARWNGGLSIKMLGPLPPAAFASVAVETVSHDQAKGARTALGVDVGADADAVQAAFRTRIKTVHPDVANQGEDDAAGDLTAHHRLLQRLAAVEAGLQAQGEDLDDGPAPVAVFRSAEGLGEAA